MTFWTSLAILAASGQAVPPGPTPPAPASSAAAREAIQAAIGQSLQGNMTAALTSLRSVPADQFAGNGARIRACILDRFGDGTPARPSPALPPTATRVLSLYRAYWRAGLLSSAARTAAEETLRRRLVALLRLPPATTLTGAEAPLIARLEREGLHVLAGVTPPFRELMIWRAQSSALRQVALPEGAHGTRVVLLDNFVSLGWSGYATCELSHTGGWVRPDGIYAVRPGWGDLDGESFRVSFLAHEAQHFADKERYGELPSWELEYRAKLTELALAEASQAALLSAFTHNQGDDQAVPHSYANRRVLASVRSRLGLAPEADLNAAAPQAIRDTARAELLADSGRRRR